RGGADQSLDRRQLGIALEKIHASRERLLWPRAGLLSGGLQRLTPRSSLRPCSHPTPGRVGWDPDNPGESDWGRPRREGALPASRIRSVLVMSARRPTETQPLGAQHATVDRLVSLLLAVGFACVRDAHVRRR